ncbi:hypothetical protein [Frondihabitans sp. PAMC 28766]|nr:hypothetical protein [Frondihabitans sp. PAMC 28766]
MDVDPLRNQTSTSQLEQAGDTRFFGTVFVSDGWLEENVRLMGND